MANVEKIVLVVLIIVVYGLKLPIYLNWFLIRATPNKLCFWAITFYFYNQGENNYNPWKLH